MDDLTKNWTCLTLFDREGPGCCLNEECDFEEFIIAAKFLTERVLKTEAIAKTFSPLWQSRNGFQVRNMGNQVMLFVFDNKAEADKVLLSEPWSFDKHLMVMQSYDKSHNIEELTFDRATFWVQIHGIPIRYMNVKAVKKICGVLGQVLPSPNPMDSEGGSFIRVRVLVDITIPLCRGRPVSWGIRKKYGLASSMNACQTFAIGAAASTMMIKTVRFG